MFCSLQRQIKVFIWKRSRSDHFKTLFYVVSQPSLNLFSTLKSGLFDCQMLPLAVSSLTTFNKTYNSFHTPVTLPQVKRPSIWSLWLFVTCFIDFAIFFELRGICQFTTMQIIQGKVGIPKIIFCTTSRHHDMHVHVRFPWPDLGTVLQKLTHHWKKIDIFLQTDLY